MRKKFLLFLISISLFFPRLTVLAQKTQLANPLGSNVNSVSDLFANIVKFLLGFVGMISLVYFIVGGFYWLTSGGSQERIKKGRDTIVWAIFGLLASLGSYLFLQKIISAVTQ